MNAQLVLLAVLVTSGLQKPNHLLTLAIVRTLAAIMLRPLAKLLLNLLACVFLRVLGRLYLSVGVNVFADAWAVNLTILVGSHRPSIPSGHGKEKPRARGQWQRILEYTYTPENRIFVLSRICFVFL